jgi:signal peptidase II
MRLGDSWPVVAGFANFTYVRNRGVAFGVLSQQGLSAHLFVLVSVAALGLILYFLRHLGEHEHLMAFGLSLVFAGAIGNIIDRLRIGEVIDFIDLYVGSHHWWFFNLADASITVGGLILAANLLFRSEAEDVQ